MVGGWTAMRIPFAAAPAGRASAVMVLVTFVKVTVPLDVTFGETFMFRLKKQVAPAARLGMLKLTLPEFGFAPVTVDPAQFVCKFGGLAATNSGNKSLNATFVAATGLGFVTVKVTVDVPANPITPGLNAFVSPSATGAGCAKDAVTAAIIKTEMSTSLTIHSFQRSRSIVSS